MCSSPQRRSPTSSALAAALLLLFCAPLSAQEESIFDPENPDAPGDTAPKDDGGGETIFDPENPDIGGPTPDPPAVTTPTAPLQLGYFKGLYRLSLGVDVFRDREGESIYEIGNHVEMRARLPLGESTSAVVEAIVDHAYHVSLSVADKDLLPGRFDDVAEPYAIYRLDLGDAYISTRFGRLLLRVGQQRIVWGRAELTRPADVVGPLDLSAGFAGAVTGFGGFSSTAPILSAKADYVTDVGTVQAILVPFFEPHRTSLLAGDLALARPGSPLLDVAPFLGLLGAVVDPSLFENIEGALGGTELPDQTPENVSAGLRLSSTFGGADVALSYFFGWDRVPFVKIDPALAELLGVLAADPEFLATFDITGLFTRNPELLGLQNELSAKAQAGEDVLSARYARWHVLAFDLETYLGPIGVRADLAFSPRRTFVTQNFTSIRRPATNAALSLSYEGDEGEIAVIVEHFWLHVFDAPGGQRSPLIFGGDFVGVAAGLRIDLEHWTPAPLILQLGGLVNLRDADAILSPALIWRLDGGTRLFAGGQIVAAPARDTRKLTIGGLYDSTDQVVLGLEQDF